MFIIIKQNFDSIMSDQGELRNYSSLDESSEDKPRKRRSPSSSSGGSMNSEEEREVDRRLQERKLQRQAQEELQREHEQNKTGITKDDMDRILAEGDRIQTKVDDVALTKKDLQKMVAKLDELFTQNQEQRELHAKDPIKFLDSESTLHAHLHEM